MDIQKIYQDLLTDAEAVRDSLVAQAQQKNAHVQQIRAVLKQAVGELNFVSGQIEQENLHILRLRDKANAKDEAIKEPVTFDTWPENS